MAVSVLKRLLTYGDNIFEFNIKYLMLVGLWHNENWTRNQKLLYKIYDNTLDVLGLIYLTLTAIGIHGNMDDITAALAGVDKSLVAYNFMLKIIVFHFRKHQLRKLVKEIIASGDVVPEEHKILVAKLSLATTTITTIIVTIFTGISVLAGELPAKVWLPFDTSKNFMNLLAGVQICLVTFGVPICYRGLALKCFVSTMIFYLRDQLIDLQVKFKELDNFKDAEEEVRTNFKKIVKKHIRLIRYSKTIDNLLREYFLIQNLAITIEVCMNSVTLTLSEGISSAAYNTSWTSWPVDMQKDLLTVIIVAQSHFKLTAGGMAVMSLETYAQTLYNGYSIFAVLIDAVN
uniref:Odorant receptor n=1 Tax=Manduca sexta TaxID=7130 RepID=A0A0P1IVJ3_MANSE|nr:Olfactory receptor 20 [Manduca sexta]